MLARTRLLLCLLFGALVLNLPATAQNVNGETRLQGYSDEDGTTYFIFDAAAHGLETRPERVVVTGAFRGWSQDMNDPAWQLQPHTVTGLWVLAIENDGYQTVGAGTPFKFRVDQGRWLDPPANASNVEGGNLVFLFGIEPTRLQAELRGEKAVWMTLTGDNVERSLDPADYRLVDAKGRSYEVAHVVPNTASETLIVPRYPLDIKRVYYLEMPEAGLRALSRRDPWFRTLYSGKELGVVFSEDRDSTLFRLFAPRANRVQLYLYFGRYDTADEAAQVVDLQMDRDGVWEVQLLGDYHGMYYDYRLLGPDDPGDYFYNTHGQHITDPYARVSDDSFGKARIWHPTDPPRPVQGGRPAMEDVIAYEVHVQDFTDLLPVTSREKGTFAGMMATGLTNSRGESIGFDYLVDLGINVVHLMPVQEYLHYPDAEWQAAFGDDPYMQRLGVSEENYQWGYRTTHSFAVESRFRTRGTEPGEERDQFRDLVEAFHDAGIAVIIDVVPNHTGENMDGRHMLFNFNGIDLPYYHRTDESLNHIGPFGNEVKTEDRPMAQRWVVDQLRHWVDELGVDGFRIDLAGQIDEQTLRYLKAELPEDLIIYGEPWIAPSDPDVNANPDWAWYKVDAPITFFQDDARNAFKGPVSHPENKATDRGYAGGDGSQRARAMLGLTNGWDEEGDPNEGINYLDIHDNWALADRFATTDWNGLEGVDEKPFKIAAGLLFTSLGPVVLHGGTEIMRSKGVAPLGETVKETATGPIYMKGRGDTYNTRTPNQFIWETVGRSDGMNDYANMHAYWRGLIRFRNSRFGEVFRIGGTVPPPDYYEFITPANEQLLGYLVDGSVLVLVNTSTADVTFDDVALPAGTWKLIANADAVNHARGVPGDDALLEGDRSLGLEVPAQSLKIWVKQ